MHVLNAPMSGLVASLMLITTAQLSAQEPAVTALITRALADAPARKSSSSPWSILPAGQIRFTGTMPPVLSMCWKGQR